MDYQVTKLIYLIIGHVLFLSVCIIGSAVYCYWDIKND
ncbi:hypothetical protein HWB19_gp050 [Cronobacter phage vB_CsaP_009]|uniref:Uncharacterized protein n=1 Tax=Cronobacter phage vB_CsaP_009 TaxID=2699738 RepID=A0A679FDW7_9CAUD|nr:hypothetical protein HWB19_gp050 [Cronobacter phage vB_CsaP_009]BBU72696.1 hypothetical protein [Cronobacter phage vB_CsaP_009]